MCSRLMCCGRHPTRPWGGSPLRAAAASLTSIPTKPPAWPLRAEEAGTALRGPVPPHGLLRSDQVALLRPGDAAGPHHPQPGDGLAGAQPVAAHHPLRDHGAREVYAAAAHRHHALLRAQLEEARGEAFGWERALAEGQVVVADAGAFEHTLVVLLGMVEAHDAGCAETLQRLFYAPESACAAVLVVGGFLKCLKAMDLGVNDGLNDG